MDEDLRETIENSARYLYGLIHARYIITTRGLAKMVSSQNVPALDVSLISLLDFSSTNTATPTLAPAPVSTVTLNPSSLLV